MTAGTNLNPSVVERYGLRISIVEGELSLQLARRLFGRRHIVAVAGTGGQKQAQLVTCDDQLQQSSAVSPSRYPMHSPATLYAVSQTVLTRGKVPVEANGQAADEICLSIQSLPAARPSASFLSRAELSRSVFPGVPLN